jgi:hypothetical protein
MRQMTNKNFTPLWRLGVVIAALSSTAAMPPISQLFDQPRLLTMNVWERQ